MNKFFKSMLFVVVLLVGHSTVFGQTPMPPLPPIEDPCVQLQQNVNMATGALNSWKAILTERRVDLANAQARLTELRSWETLFWTGVAEQGTPMSDGQIMFISWINSQITSQETYVAAMQAQVLQAEQQVGAWTTALNQANAAFTAAGC